MSEIRNYPYPGQAAAGGGQIQVHSYDLGAAPNVKGLNSPKRAPVDAAMNELQDRIQRLAALAQSIELRFGAALRQNPPQTQAPLDARGQPTFGATSPLGSLLADRCAQLRGVEVALEDILSRCEL